jgi:hypothetical protein
MPLNWNSSKCKPAQDKGEEQMRHTLCILTVRIGIFEITQKNAAEVYARVHILEEINGAFHTQAMPEGLMQRPYLPSDIKRWIGLNTNASSLTRTQFLKSISNQMDDYAREYREMTK